MKNKIYFQIKNFYKTNNWKLSTIIVSFLLLTSNIYFIFLKNDKYTTSLNNIEVNKQENYQKLEINKDINQYKIKTLAFLQTYNKDRSTSAICGYSPGDITNKLILSKKNNINAKYGSGVWSNDCNVYIYGVSIHMPASVIFSNELKNTLGIWAYYPSTNANVQILSTVHETNPYPQVHRFISTNLVSAAGKIINIKNKQVVDTFDDKTEWIRYRDSLSPWMYMTPPDWFVNINKTKSFDTSSENNSNYKELVFTTSEDVDIHFFTEMIDFDLSNYSNDKNSEMENLQYEYYYNHQLNPQMIFIYNGTKSYPKTITINTDPYEVGFNRYSPVNKIRDMLPMIIEKIEDFK